MPIMLTNYDIDRAIDLGIRKGVRAAGSYLVTKLKRELSVPAERRKAVRPRERTVATRTVATRRIVALTRATPGAPPRKLSGRLRSSIGLEVSPDGKSIKIGTDLFYAEFLEFKDHPFLRKLIDDEMPNVTQMIGEYIAAELKKLE
jgi:hypothetical protein